jgi:hypothetical protein
MSTKKSNLSNGGVRLVTRTLKEASCLALKFQQVMILKNKPTFESIIKIYNQY